MKPKHFIFYLFISLGLGCYSPTLSQTQTATVVKVIDGDSFIVNTSGGELEIRLNGIDCPEFDQPYGDKAKSIVNELLFHKVNITSNGVDKYGRTLVDVYYKEVWINYFLVENGYAWHFKQYSDNPDLASAEFKAKTGNLGLWALENPIAPWDWRENNTSNSTSFNRYQQNNNLQNSVQPAQSKDNVVICGGAYSKRYHASQNCRGLSNCRGGISTITLKEAEKLGRTPCQVCYR